MPQQLLHKLRLQLTDYSALLPYAILGIIAGIGGALITLSFELVIEWGSLLWFSEQGIDNYESLHWSTRVGLIMGSALLLGLALRWLSPDSRQIGIAHVIGRLHTHHGHLPIKNALVQYLAGALALICGQSGGREGPEDHLGAAVNSYLGQRLKLPNNSLRILVASGTAAAIAAAFNTPIAGVIFAMEVVIAEYTVIGFLPVILAAVTATTISRALTGGVLLLNIPAIEMTSLWELPFIAVLGLLAGTASALLTIIMKQCFKHHSKPLVIRLGFAGLVTACFAIVMPQVMGLGYDTLNQALNGSILPSLLLAIAVCKLITTAVSCGMGMPIGLIGPSLLIGGLSGWCAGRVGPKCYARTRFRHSVLYRHRHGGYHGGYSQCASGSTTSCCRNHR